MPRDAIGRAIPRCSVVPPLDAAHRERRSFGPAQPAAQENGWRLAQPDAGGRLRRQPPVARRRDR
jgi:hypothetical protein